MMASLFARKAENILPCDGSLILSESFYAATEAAALFQRLEKEIEWQQLPIKIFGKELMQPRLMAWYGAPEASYTYSGLSLKPQDFTPLLLQIKTAIEQESGHNFNSVLLNLYKDGNHSMGWHSDDEKELGPEPTIASLSLGGTRHFKLKHRTEKDKKLSLALQSGDLLLMEGSMQRYWLHAIPKTNKPCGPRINLTFRQILPQL